MTTQEKLIHRKQSLLELAEYLKNVSAACRVMGVSRQARPTPPVEPVVRFETPS